MPPRRPAPAPAARLRRLAPLTVLAIAACGGGDGGGVTNPPPSTTQQAFNVNAQAALAQGTSDVTVRFAPYYERASGERVALASNRTSVGPGGAAQTLAANVELAACLGDPNRRGADATTAATAPCPVSAAVWLQNSTGTTLDSVIVGPYGVRGGASTDVAVSFVQVTGVTVTREGGAAVGGQPVPMQIGQTLDLAATATGTGGATVARPVGFSSGTPAVATVDPATGVITAVGVGTARITVTAGGQTATVDVAVLAPVAVTLAGNGAGGVASGPAGVSCTTGSTAGCAGTFTPGTSVTLTATPDGNSTFTGWSGDCTGTGACTVAADRARAVTATFGRRRVALSVTVGGNGGSGDVLVTGGNVAPATPCAAGTCAYTVDAGVIVNINARPAAGSLVGTWGGELCAGTSGPTCSKALTADAAAGVTFTARDLVNVTATSSTGATLGGTFDFQGTVNGNPTQPIAIVISTTTPQTGFAFDQSSSVTIRFAPNAASRLVSWGGICQGAAVADQTGLSSCTFTSAANTSVVINLAPR
jgi:hypothetical protein